ncbi:hypothetical protein F2Q68_00022495 [Brassica cretica]|uniref:Superoxide dismutase [Cu-Zn] n=1 Tax=Brassica cretica TaxID=69181 RepID=A0A8S9G2K4_BRACR|nr:hypothetical protein F2Q68_00022495 [Brassica cretica]
MGAPNLRAVALIAGDSNVRGCLHFTQDTSGTTHVTGKISGLSPGFHGFHIHSFGDTTNGCNSTGWSFNCPVTVHFEFKTISFTVSLQESNGPHFNPLNRVHGPPDEVERHAGDLGNIFAGPDGVAEISIKDKQIPLSGQYSILGRAVVVHGDPDDLGRGGHKLSKSTGNAGARVGCGIIGLQSAVDPKL